MVERHEGLDSRLLHRDDLVTVMIHRGLVELAGLWLDPAPFDAHPVDLMVHLPHEADILSDTVPVVVRDTAMRAVLDPAHFAPTVPCVAGIPAFYLKGSGRASEKEIFREIERFVFHNASVNKNPRRTGYIIEHGEE